MYLLTHPNNLFWWLSANVVNHIKEIIKVIWVCIVSIPVKNTLAGSCLCMLGRKMDGPGDEFLVLNHRQTVNVLVCGKELFHRPRDIGGRIQLV